MLKDSLSLWLMESWLWSGRNFRGDETWLKFWIVAAEVGLCGPTPLARSKCGHVAPARTRH